MARTLQVQLTGQHTLEIEADRWGDSANGNWVDFWRGDVQYEKQVLRLRAGEVLRITEKSPASARPKSIQTSAILTRSARASGFALAADLRVAAASV